MTQTSDTLLRLQDVSKRFGKKTALDHISLEIAPGRMVGLLGSNGSGKSTLIKLINGLLVPSSGQIPLQCAAFQNRGDNIFDAGRCTAVGKEKAAGRPPGGCRRDTGAGGTLDGYDPGTDAADYSMEVV